MGSDPPVDGRSWGVGEQLELPPLLAVWLFAVLKTRLTGNGQSRTDSL